MPEPKVYHDIYIGSAIGTFKRYSTNESKVSDINPVANIKKGDEIVDMIWRADKTKIVIGQLNGVIKEYDLDKNKIKILEHVQLEEKTKFVGLGTIKNSNKKIIKALSNGKILYGKNAHQILDTGKSALDRMIQCESNMTKLATGGNENSLKVWDLETSNQLFMAKNIPHDELQLRVPIWVSDITFLSEFELATSSRYSVVSFYDTRAQRRPITRYQSTDDSAYSCITATGNRTVAVGGGKGALEQIDLRQGRAVHKYKGCVGGVKDVYSMNNTLLFSVGLDRRLRIHDLNRTCLIDDVYLKSKLNCLLVKETEIAEVKQEDEESGEEQKSNKRKQILDQGGEEDYLYENTDIYEDGDCLKKKKRNR